MRVLKDDEIMMMDDEKLSEAYLEFKKAAEELIELVNENYEELKKLGLEEKLNQLDVAIYNFRKCSLEFESRRRTKEFAKSGR